MTKLEKGNPYPNFMEGFFEISENWGIINVQQCLKRARGGKWVQCLVFG